MGIAARVADYVRRWPGGFTAPTAAGPAPGGGAFLPELFGGQARQLVEMAFGADLSADPDTWSWTDVTSSFLWDPGVNIGIGRPPESTRITPATFTGTIRNDQPNGGDWTVGNALSPHWPNVRENTPVRARLDVGNGPTVRFQGYAVSFKPTTMAVGDDGNRISVVQFKAAGIARRLFQGASAPQSPMWRSVMLAYRYPIATNTSGGGYYVNSGDGGYAALPARYWPLEDGYGALQGTDALDATYSLKATSFGTLPDFSSGTIGVGSKSLAVFKTGATLTAAFPTVLLGASQRTDVYAGSSVHTQFLMKLTQAAFDTIFAGGVDVEIMRFTMAGTIARWSVWLDPDPGGLSIYMRAYDSAGATLGTTPLFNDDAIIDADVEITVIFNQNGANTENRILYNPLGTTPNSGVPFGENEYVAYDININSRTHVGVKAITVAPGADLAGIIIGHLSVHNGGEGTFPDITNKAPRGRPGDTVELRMRRLSIENAVPLDLVGTADLAMGVQGIGGYLDLMTECETVDSGALLDGLGPGLTYVCRTSAYGKPAGLTLDAGDGQVLTPLPAEHDDLGRVNSFTADNPAGGQQSFTKEVGDLGTDEVGVYDSSGSFPVALDSTLYDEAAWRVHLGTVKGLRYPNVSFELAKEVTAPLAQNWLNSRPFDRLDILDLEPGTVDPDGEFLLRSWSERWNSLLWSVTAAMSPYAPWGIATLAAATGDRSDFLFRPSAGYSTLTADVPTGTGFADEMEDGVGVYTPTDCTFVSSGAKAYLGTLSGLMTTVGTPSQATVRTPNIAVVPGQSIAGVLWAFSVAGYSSVYAVFDWYDSGFGYLSTSGGSPAALAANTWEKRATGAQTVPAGAAYAQFGVTLGSSPAAGTAVYLDAFKVGPALTVATSSGPVWTTVDDDIDGLVIEVAGLRIPVGHITGSTSPQTFTVDGTKILKALSSGASVDVWQAPALGL